VEEGINPRRQGALFARARFWAIYLIFLKFYDKIFIEMKKNIDFLVVFCYNNSRR
jgi:hypothetical protein